MNLSALFVRRSVFKHLDCINSSCRFREGLQTLGVFDQVNKLFLSAYEHTETDSLSQHRPFNLIQVQLYPSAFCTVFCKAAVRLTAQAVSRLFTVNFSQQEDKLNRETAVISFWRHFLLECEGTPGLFFYFFFFKQFWWTVSTRLYTETIGGGVPAAADIKIYISYQADQMIRVQHNIASEIK